MFNLPNMLSLARIVIIPFVFVIYYLPIPWGHTAAAIMFMLACLTDWLDGYLARTLKLSTPLGAFLDPVADKIMVCVVLVLVVGESRLQTVPFHKVFYHPPAIMVTVPAAIIVSREIIVSALREWMAELGRRTSVAVSRLGKVKTAIQMIALTLLVYCTPVTQASIVLTGYILLYVAALLTVWSMVIYLKAAWLAIKNEESPEISLDR